MEKKKHCHIVKCHGCYLEANVSKESMAVKSTEKINAKLPFFHRQNKLPNPKLGRLFRNSLTQPRFDLVPFR